MVALFNKFVKYRVLPYYLASNGARLVIVVDNIKIYYNSELVVIYKEARVTLAYLPTYSPNLNLIETLFAVLKV